MKIGKVAERAHVGALALDGCSDVVERLKDDPLRSILAVQPNVVSANNWKGSQDVFRFDTSQPVNKEERCVQFSAQRFSAFWIPRERRSIPAQVACKGFQVVRRIRERQYARDHP